MNCALTGTVFDVLVVTGDEKSYLLARKAWNASAVQQTCGVQVVLKAGQVTRRRWSSEAISTHTDEHTQERLRGKATAPIGGSRCTDGPRSQGAPRSLRISPHQGTEVGTRTGFPHTLPRATHQNKMGIYSACLEMLGEERRPELLQ